LAQVSPRLDLLALCFSIGEMLFPSAMPALLVHICTIVYFSRAEDAAYHPRNYAAWRAPAPIEINGDIYKKVWDEVPWSEDFVEIRGKDSPDTAPPMPTSDTRTRVKMRWDKDFLYVAAEMSAQGWPITADFTKRNEPIFQKDSDIEVFLDTDGSNANYKEFELNARNTAWNLMLNRPYSSGGGEHSGRVAKAGEDNYWDVKGQKTSAKMYGAVGKRQPDGKWTAEIAFSHTDTLDRTSGEMPKEGKFWRIGFSRVEKKGDINWVWTPQMLWAPTEGKYTGQVNMHAPDAWGYVVFTEVGGPAGPQKDWVDPAFNSKAAAHQLFYAEKHAMTPEGGGKLLTLEVLKQKGWIDKSLFDRLDATVTKASDGTWTARVQDASGCFSTIQQDNLHSYQCATSLFGLILPPLGYVGFGSSFLVIAFFLTAYWVQHKRKLNGERD